MHGCVCVVVVLLLVILYTMEGGDWQERNWENMVIGVL